MVCIRCHRVIEYVSPEIEALQEKIATDHGFEIVDHTHVIYVTCPNADCISKPNGIEPLLTQVFSFYPRIVRRPCPLKS